MSLAPGRMLWVAVGGTSKGLLNAQNNRGGGKAAVVSTARRRAVRFCHRRPVHPCGPSTCHAGDPQLSIEKVK